MDSTEKWGDDVDSAVELALADLKLTREQVEIEVLEQPSRGFFGIGSKLAHVRVSRKQEAPVKPEPKNDTPEPAKVEEPAVEPVEEVKKEETEAAAAVEAEEKPARRSHSEKSDRKHGKGDRRERRSRGHSEAETEYVSKLPEMDFHREMDQLPEADDHPAKVFLTDVVEKMGLDLKIDCKADESHVLIDINGVDTRTIIGKRGQTLDAIQYLTSLVVNKDHKDYIKVVVDAENYRSRREKTLEQLADRLARKVVKTRHSVRLEPMNPYERKVIHSTLQSNPDVTTRSEGQDPYRRVIIELK